MRLLYVFVLEQVRCDAIFLYRVLFEMLLFEEDFVLNLFRDVRFQIVGPFLRGILIFGVLEIGSRVLVMQILLLNKNGLVCQKVPILLNHQ